MEYPSVVLFDGFCQLCSASVSFIRKRDGRLKLQFVALQSGPGIYLRRYLNIPDTTDSVILWKEGKIFLHSDAALEIAKYLRFPWPAFVVFRFVPKAVRNRIYTWIAGNRYRWFGKREFCRLPEPEERMLFPSQTDLELQIARFEAAIQE